MKKRKTAAFTALALVLIILFAACSAADNAETSGSYNNWSTGSADMSAPSENMGGSGAGGGMDGGMGDYGSYYYDDMEKADESGSSLPDISETDPNRKLIRRAYTTLETTEFENSVAHIEALCAGFQGFTESSSISGSSITERYKQYRSASYVFRIPSVRYNEFLNSVGAIGNVISKSQESQDVTDSYYDIESRLRILRMRQERLEKLLDGETESEAIVNFERSLSDTLYEIERLTGNLKRYDSLVEYSTISVFLREVEKYTEIQPIEPAPQTVGGRIKASFGDSTEAIGKFFVNLTVFVIGNILYLLIWAAVITGAVIAFRRLWKKQPVNKPTNSNTGGE